MTIHRDCREQANKDFVLFSLTFTDQSVLVAVIAALEVPEA